MYQPSEYARVLRRRIAPSSLTAASRLNFASVAGSTGPSLGRSQALFSASINSASVRVFCGSLGEEKKTDEIYSGFLR